MHKILGNGARKEMGIDFFKVGNNSVLISLPREIWQASESIRSTAGNGTQEFPGREC
jgi:hypothetical protein